MLLRMVAGARDVLVEEADRQFDVNTRAVARFAVRIDRTPVPHRLQRIDTKLHDPPRRLAVDGRDQPDAAGIGFELGPVHPLGSEAFMFGRVGCHSEWSSEIRLKVASRAAPPALTPTRSPKAPMAMASSGCTSVSFLPIGDW